MRVIRLTFCALSAFVLGGCALLGGAPPLDKDASMKEGFRLLDDGKYSYAMGMFNGILDTDPYYAPARYGLGRIFTETGYSDGAEEQFRRAVVLDSTYGPAYLGLGRLYYELGDYERAERNILDARRHGAGDTPLAAYLLGLFSEKRGSFWEAEASFKKALDSEPDNSDYRLALVDLLRGRGRYEDALTELERREFPRGSDDGVRLRFADCRLHLGQDLEAERLFREILNRNRNWPEPRWGLAILALRRKDMEEAADQIHRYALLVPLEEVEVFESLAESLASPDPLFRFTDRCRAWQQAGPAAVQDRLAELLLLWEVDIE